MPADQRFQRQCDGSAARRVGTAAHTAVHVPALVGRAVGEDESGLRQSIFDAWKLCFCWPPTAQHSKRSTQRHSQCTRTAHSTTPNTRQSTQCSTAHHAQHTMDSTAQRTAHARPVLCAVHVVHIWCVDCVFAGQSSTQRPSQCTAHSTQHHSQYTLTAHSTCAHSTMRSSPYLMGGLCFAGRTRSSRTCTAAQDMLLCGRAIRGD